MKTDVFIRLFSDTYEQAEMDRDIAESFQSFREFAARFSRFKKESELSQFNASEGGKVSSELFSLLTASARFHSVTEGVFDPSVLPILEKIGYGGAADVQLSESAPMGSFAQLIFDEAEQSVHKPKNVFIDLGGIGKGYIVDKVACRLMEKYAHGIVDAGGDMRLFGSDRGQDIDSWAIDVENPFDTSRPLSTLLVTDCAVATSGSSRKHWQREGRAYHHLIDPSSGTSAATGLSQVTVIASSAMEADVFAKTLFILGLERGQVFASEKKIPALFVTEEKEVIRNPLMQEYEWKI